METNINPIKSSQPARLIAITGLAGCGKSTVAEYLHRDYGFVRRKFAGPLKAMLQALYEWTDLDTGDITARLEGAKKERPDPVLNGATPRWAMQSLGTEWGRDSIHPDIWVDLLRRRVERDLALGWSVVIDDLRFPNEGDVVEALGGKVLQIYRHRPGLLSASDPHVSEQYVRGGDWVIRNTGTTQALYSDVRYFLNYA